jgi:hypothetical protein
VLRIWVFNTTYEKRSNEILAQREVKHAHTEFSTNETLHTVVHPKFVMELVYYNLEFSLWCYVAYFTWSIPLLGDY